MGITPQGINREVTMSIECADRLKDDDPEDKVKQQEKPLGFPRLAVLNCAASIPSKKTAKDERKKVILTGADDDTSYHPTWKNIARGILPSLIYVTGEQIENSAATDAAVTETKTETDSAQTTALGRDYGSIDPFGNDYFCVNCQCELPNLYYSCNGCEHQLDKEYRICSACLQKRSYLENRVMGLDKEKTDIETIDFDPLRHHCGIEKEDQTQLKRKKPKLPTKKRAKINTGILVGDKTRNDSTGDKCSDRFIALHRQFTEHRRFLTENSLRENLKKCEEWVEDDVVPFFEETVRRLRRLKLSQNDVVVAPKPYYPDLLRD